MTQAGPKNQDRPDSANVKKLAARLAAVQACYQLRQNRQALEQLIDEYLYKWAGMEVEGEALVKPDGALFTGIIQGVSERKQELEAIIQAHYKGYEKQGFEPLLHSIMICGVYELLSHQDIDAPIIVNDYMHVVNSFYEKGEASLVNGVLDAAAKTLR